MDLRVDPDSFACRDASDLRALHERIVEQMPKRELTVEEAANEALEAVEEMQGVLEDAREVSDVLDAREEMRDVHVALENLWMVLAGITAVEEDRRLRSGDDESDEEEDTPVPYPLPRFTLAGASPAHPRDTRLVETKSSEVSNTERRPDSFPPRQARGSSVRIVTALAVSGRALISQEPSYLNGLDSFTNGNPLIATPCVARYKWVRPFTGEEEKAQRRNRRWST